MARIESKADSADNDDSGDDRRKGGGRSGGGGPRRKVCRFCAETTVQIDYKNPQLLKGFITDRGKMVPRRISGTCARHQRAVSLALRRSRQLALLPFTVTGE
ncbi:MAG: 30S ribosomal protein S18 [Kofleriaceae bacterium]|nr:30S ribosomal protein S18 [Myxococcales bacterium]MCB9565014.1 30S ribosomal protein S18 [Kofleriaceae bacterium]MCB9575073.1 30S ribosomal protein S18 [Kofleriaceae bacterium]